MDSRVVFADSRLKEAFDKLKDTRTEDKNFYMWLNRAFDDLSNDPFCGIQIPKKQIPKIYIKKYGSCPLFTEPALGTLIILSMSKYGL